MQQLTRAQINAQLAQFRAAHSGTPRHLADFQAATCLGCRAHIAEARGQGQLAADLRGAAIVCRSRAVGLPDPC